MTQDSLMNVPSQISVLMERPVQVMREKGLVMPDYLLRARHGKRARSG